MPYGLWESDLAIETLVNQTAAPAYPFRHNGALYWLAAQSQQQGRIALMQAPMQKSPSAEPICITPKNFNIRSAVHEYGGRCFCIVGDSIIFNHYADGHLYRQSLASKSPESPQRLTHHSMAHPCCGYADLVAVGKHEFILAIMETRRDNAQNDNNLVAISLHSGIPILLAQGADFYANPVVSSEGKKIAWFEWSHPNMPWDQSRLCCAELEFDPTNGTPFLAQQQVLVDQPNCAVCQLGFLADGRLIFVSDSETCDYWSLFQYQDGEITRLTYGNEEFGEAHWLFGQCRWQPVGDNLIIAVATRQEGDVLVEVDCDRQNCRVLPPVFSVCNHLQVDANELLFVAHYASRAAEIASLSLPSASIQTLPVMLGRDAKGEGIRGHSEPKLIQFPLGKFPHDKSSAPGAVAYGYFYAPYNVSYCAPKNTLPPLMIVIHGGPTSRATSAYSSLKQYFCSLGFAVLDINHRGSTGLGRKYRQSLLGNWGEFDADDIAAAIEFADHKKWIDKDLVFIRGSSAGGYAVLRALTRFPQQFAGGACYYGIGNLVTLSAITHKFESQYTNRLVGEEFNPERATKPTSRFVTRSPIFQMDQLASPLILFQGLDDKVVPPELSREVVACLKKKGIKHRYTEYTGEGHGFRQTQTKADALRKETAFFVALIKKHGKLKMAGMPTGCG